MTDEEIAKFYEKTQRAYLVDTGTFDPELREGDLAHDYWVDVGKLLAEVKWQHRALEIARDVAEAPEDDWDEVCPLCASGPGSTPIQHEQWCAIARARALLADRGEP